MSSSRVGSSPRLRGTPDGGWAAYPVPGIIPALAGNTLSMYHAARLYWDHPRACGEHDMEVITALETLGSSPRLRGTHVGHAEVGQCLGIIPALAGNTTM